MRRAVFRPIDLWPGELRSARQRATFRASYADTLSLLDRELDHLRVHDLPVIQLALSEDEIRLDGMPRAGATPAHPGVILSFESRTVGPLRYFTDAFDAWRDNLRAIALGLHDLRRVERYGIARRGEQYTGWKALGSGGGPIAMGSGVMSADEAAMFVLMHGDPSGADTVDAVLADPEVRQRVYRAAARRLHPDAGGDEALFKRLREAMDVLGGGS